MAVFSRLAGFLGRRRRKRSGLPQLRMVYAGPRPPEPGPELAPPYARTPFAPGDESRWLALLHGDGEGGLGPWTLQRLRLDVLAFLVPGTQWFIWCGDAIAAGAGVYERSPAAWEVGWVATHPAHRGRGLGQHVVAAAVDSALRLPSRPVWLFTDDHRLPALGLYLRLGFVPDCHHPSHQGRWQRLLGHLDPALRSQATPWIH